MPDPFCRARPCLSCWRLTVCRVRIHSVTGDEGEGWTFHPHDFPACEDHAHDVAEGLREAWEWTVIETIADG